MVVLFNTMYLFRVKAVFGTAYLALKVCYVFGTCVHHGVLDFIALGSGSWCFSFALWLVD